MRAIETDSHLVIKTSKMLSEVRGVLLETEIEIDIGTGVVTVTVTVTGMERATLIDLLKFTSLTLWTPSLTDHHLRITFATAVEKKVRLELPTLWVRGASEQACC